MDQQPHQHQSPAPYDPAKRSRGPLVLALVAVLAVAVVAIGAIVLLRDDSEEPAPDAKRSTPASPEAVQLRRVIAVTPCTDKPADCAADGMRYRLGQVELDGGHIESVTTERGQDSGWQITMTLDTDGAKLFGKLTTEIFRKDPPANQLAIEVRGRVVSAPTVQGAITDGRVQITGHFSQESAEKLAAEITG